MSRSGSDIRKSEAQSKMIQDRITAVEKHLGTLCDTLSSYTRKTARLRDKGDLLAKEVVNYAEYEKFNPTLKKGLTAFAEHLSAVQDYRQAEVQRLEAKSVNPLSNYGLLCKQTKNELKTAFTAHDREQAQKKKLDKVQQKHPSDITQIAQSELQKASVDATRSERALEQQMETFESKKLEDVKKVLSDFVQIEMMFHAKALEVYTQCYQSLSLIEPEQDLEEFISHIHPGSVTNSKRLSIASTASQNSGEHLVTPRSTPRSTPKSTPTSLRKEENTSKQHTSKQTPPQQQRITKQTTPRKQSSTGLKSQNSPHQTPPKSQKSSKPPDSPARRIIPVGTLKDESDEEEYDDDGVSDSDDYDTDDDDSDEYDDETTEASTARTANGTYRTVNGTPHTVNGKLKK